MTKEQILATTEYIARLLLSLRNGEGPAPLPEGMTLAEVYKVSSRHSLAPAAYAMLRDVIGESDVPESASAMWSRELDLATVQHVRHTTAFAEITSAFSGAKISFLPIKGFIIKALWKRPELRTMADMDIVVSPEAFEQACEILVSLGYELEHDDVVHASYTKNKFINVELHRMLYDGASQSFSDWIPKADNAYWYEMTYPDLVSFLLRHAYKHYESGGCGLRAIYDFYLLFDRYGSPDGIPGLMERLDREGLGEFANIIVALIDRWFLGHERPDVEQAALYIATGGVYGTLDNGVSYSIKKRGSKSGHVIHRLFPPCKVIMRRYKWVEKCPILLPVGYVVRFITALFDRRSYRELESVRSNNEK